jgi:hypothetical protein
VLPEPHFCIALQRHQTRGGDDLHGAERRTTKKKEKKNKERLLLLLLLLLVMTNKKRRVGASVSASWGG